MQSQAKYQWLKPDWPQKSKVLIEQKFATLMAIKEQY